MAEQVKAAAWKAAIREYYLESWLLHLNSSSLLTHLGEYQKSAHGH